ncbi:hypothetical protein C6P40_005282 [Pichia californica]|uniref:LicD/FKTN/FKRP nucleotidyltransferase domain-containing protein n=1 Tax=Pichia californica TaxID=460514 RepID=A0A9P7BHV9_9ASCO|nr:hypothetical protein C6P40_005282 [[Candida] californica]
MYIGENTYKDKTRDTFTIKLQNMGITGLQRRILKKPFIILVLTFCYIIYSLYFSIDTSILLENDDNISQIEQNKLSNFKFKNPLSYLITPNVLFDNKIIEKSTTAPVIITNQLSKKLLNPQVENSSWRFINSFTNYKLDSEKDSSLINNYVTMRTKKHLYDPRITLSVYLNHLNDQLNSNEFEIPFSWEDWVDLSYLNKFLENRHENTCINLISDKKLYNVLIKRTLDSTKPSSFYFNDTLCLDNSEFMESPNGKFRSENLLPGFNFANRIDYKSNFIFKSYNAKSYLLSYAPPPSQIYFLNDDGKYFKVKSYQSTNMMSNGLFENYILNENYDGFNPVNQINKINKNFLTIKESNFINKLSKSNYQIDIPESNFELNFENQFKNLFDKDESELEEFEKSFIDSIKLSLETSAENVSKYFKEVNINWPTSYNGHKLKENGGHYDARFFSGFISEMPNSELTFHSPYYEKNGINHMSSNSNIDRRSIILSHLLHTLLTITFHDGLFLWPAHGSLLAWYFTSMSFPWDGDGDVQMPIKDLAEFCLNYNNSMIVQNPKFGTGKYFVDCTSSLTHRGKESGNNNIDARIVDIDTGVFVDITGLGISSDRLTNSNMNKLGDYIPKSVRSVYPTKKSNKRKVNGRKSNVGPAAARIKQKRGAELKSAKSLQEEEDNIMDDKILEIHKTNKIYNCRNDHYYTYDMISPVRLTLFEGAPTFVVANENSLNDVLQQEYTNVATRRQAWEEWVFSKSLRMWIHAQDIYQSCKDETDASLRTKKGKKKSTKNLKGAAVVPCYNRKEGKIISELLRKSLYEITEDELFIKGIIGMNEDSSEGKFKQLRMNIIEEFYQDGVYVNAHTKEMYNFHKRWEWKTPTIDDEFNLPKDWIDLARWMLNPHKPPRMAILDYLIYTEAHDQDNEIILPSNLLKVEVDTNETMLN